MRAVNHASRDESTRLLFAVLGEANRCTRVTAIDLRWLEAVVLGKNRAHLEVGYAHLSTKCNTLGFLLGIYRAQILTIDVLRQVSIISLCYGHHLVFTRHIAQVNIRSGVFLLQTHRVGLGVATRLTDKSRFGFTSVGTRLSEVDRVDRFGDSLLFSDLAAVPLTLANEIVCLTLRGDRSFAPVNILQ